MRFQNLFSCLLLAVLCCSQQRVLAKDVVFLAGEKKVQIQTLQSDTSSCILPFNRVGNLMIVKARVDTTEGNFILDTGAPHLVLNLTYFRDYPIETHQDGEQTSISGRGDYIYKTKVRELAFGNMYFHRLEADVSNLGNIENARGIKLLGLLGLDLFRRCEMIIDFEKNEIYLHRIGKKEASTYKHPMLHDTTQYREFPIEFSNNRMLTVTEVAGKKLKLVIDCAAESNILDSRLPDRILEQITITRRVKLTGPGNGKADALYGSLAKMKMGAQQINNLPVVIINLEFTCFNDDSCVNGVLGFDFLSQHKIAFNFVNRKMYIWK
jgi:predicted aspartyl protease